jgi:hypothetical protein
LDELSLSTSCIALYRIFHSRTLHVATWWLNLMVNTVEPQCTYSSIYVLPIYVLIFLNALLYIFIRNSIYVHHLTYSNSIYVHHLMYSNSIYVLSKVRITNTGLRISKYEGPIELHGDFGELVHQDWNCS